jgi:hypothetical protein
MSYHNKMFLKNQHRIAKEFAAFMTIVIDKNLPCEIFVVVDQELAPSSLVIGKEGRELLTWLGEWAIGVKLKLGEDIKTMDAPDEMPF